MSKSRLCPLCKSKAQAIVKDYNSGKLDRDTNTEIIVKNIETYHCSNVECNHEWLPLDQERKIDSYIAKRSRFDLDPSEVKIIRESFPFSNKFHAANFLCLNEKAFSKWELGRFEPNRAYDLLLRLSAHSRDNFNFIKHLHETNFKFNPQDYELICDKHNMKWNFQIVQNSEFPSKTTSMKVYTFNVKSNEHANITTGMFTSHGFTANSSKIAVGYAAAEEERAHAS